MELKTCENNVQCKCGLMHHVVHRDASISIVGVDGVKGVDRRAKLFIDGVEKGNVVSLEYTFLPFISARIQNGFKLIFTNEDEEGNTCEHTLVVENVPTHSRKITWNGCKEKEV